MIVIDVIMWPGGDKTRAYRLGKATITNVGGTADSGNYEAVIAGKTNNKLRIASIKDFPRLRLTAWHLLKLVLERTHAR